MCLSKKLDHHFLGPFPIIEEVLSHVFQLSLSLALSCIHPIFHVSLLQPSSSSEIPNRVIYPPPPMELDDLDEWEVSHILNSKFNHHCKGSGLLISLSAKALTTPLMQQAGNHMNTLQMCPPWSKLSIGPILTSPLPKSLNYFFTSSLHITLGLTVNIFWHSKVTAIIFLQADLTIYNSSSASATTLPIHLPHMTLGM